MSSKLNRRRFLRTSAGLVGLGGTVLISGCPEEQAAPPDVGTAVGPSGTGPTETGEPQPESGKVGANRLVGHPDPAVEAVLAQGAERSREELVKAAIDAYGGIDAFVQKGDTVVIKPNLGWAKSPEAGVDTHPEIVGTLVNLCKEAGASRIIVGEHSCETWEVVKLTCGVPEAVEAGGAHMVGWQDERLYEEVEFPLGESTKADMVARDVLECDVLINCPKFKHHSATEICGAMKNQLGLILRPQDYHQTTDIMAKDPNLHVNIADLASAVRPTLTVADLTNACYVGGPKGGPGSEVRDYHTVIVSSDIVACDALGTEALDICTIDDVPHIRIAAEERGLGRVVTSSDPAVKTV